MTCFFKLVLGMFTILAVSEGFCQKQSVKQHRSQKLFVMSEGVSSSAAKSIGFIGLGLMGDGMARRLLVNNCPVTIWNRSKDKCDELKAAYGDMVHVAASPADVVSRSDITFLMLSTPEVTKSAYVGPDGLLSAISVGKSIVDCATLAPADMMWANAEVHAKGGLFLEGPVSGSKVPAEKGQLIFLLAGDQLLAQEAQPYLAFMGKANHFIGTEVGGATKMKLIVNAILSNMLACLAEGISMTTDSGLSSSVLLDVLGQGAMASPLIALKGPVSALVAHLQIKFASTTLLTQHHVFLTYFHTENSSR